MTDSAKPTMAVKIGKANIPTPREKTVIIAQTDYTVFNSWNGMIPNGAPAGSGFDTMVKEAMFYLNLATGELMPWLCTEYKYNADHTELTFTFDPKAAWNDGKPLTSEDFKYTVLLLRSRKDLLGGGGDLSDFVKSVETPDAQTAIVKLTKSNPRFHYNFICVIAGGFDIRPAHIWKDKDPTKFRDNPPVRSGPYMLDKAIQSQKMFVWKKNPNYWAKDKLDPKPDYVIFQSTAKQADSASLAFERCEFDVGSIDEEHAKQLRSKGYPALITTQFHDPCPRALWLNNDPSRGIISDPAMHWVVNHLLDREKIGTNVWPVKVPPAQYPWADYPTNAKWTNDEIAKKYPFTYDPKAAEQLLDGIAPKGADGKRLYKGKPAKVEIITPVTSDGAEYVLAKLLKDNLDKLGVPTTLRSLSGSVHDEKFQRGQFDITSNWVCDVSWDPEQPYRNLESDRAAKIGTNAVDRNKVRLKDPALDALSKQLANLDPTTPDAKILLDKALEQYFQKLPVIPVIQTGYPSYFNTTFWKGWPTDDDLYQVPLNWWGQFMFVLGKLEPTGQVGA
ncbi:MAG TPA: ABC transporter substrate-binding protein [Actinopolymorphaceae bacterium]